jgi:hypothetical protein
MMLGITSVFENFLSALVFFEIQYEVQFQPNFLTYGDIYSINYSFNMCFLAYI